MTNSIVGNIYLEKRTKRIIIDAEPHIMGKVSCFLQEVMEIEALIHTKLSHWQLHLLIIEI